MPDVEVIKERIPAFTYKGERAWLTTHVGSGVSLPPVMGFVFRPHFYSVATLNWARKMRRDPDRLLPSCLLGSPPSITTSYLGPTDAQSAWKTHLTLLDFYDRLNDSRESAELWRALRELCPDELEYQFRASSLVRTSLSAVAGQEEQWNGPRARVLFEDVKTAIVALYRSIEAAARELPTPPSQDGFGESIARGPSGPYTAEEWEAMRRKRKDEEEDADHENQASESSETHNDYDERLDANGLRMRRAWEKFWYGTVAASVMCALLAQDAASVEEALGVVEKFNVFKDPEKRRINYLTSRVVRHLNRQFPSKPDGAIVHVCEELAHIAYGESVRDAAFKLIRRLRND
jgi:hypothetical protein